MTPEEKAAAFDRLAEMLLIPPDLLSAKAAYAALEELVDERSWARDAQASLELERVKLDRAGYVVALSGDEYAMPMKGRIYRTIPDKEADACGLIRVLADDDATDADGHLFDRKSFSPVTLAPTLAEALEEINRCHLMLGLIYEDMCLLEPTMSMEQLLLLPINLCKYWKHPEWEERYVRYTSGDGTAARLKTRLVRAERLREWVISQGRIAPMLDEYVKSMKKDGQL